MPGLLYEYKNFKNWLIFCKVLANNVKSVKIQVRVFNETD